MCGQDFSRTTKEPPASELDYPRHSGTTSAAVTTPSWRGRIAGVTRTGDLAATITHEDPLRLYRTFVTIVVLCRSLVE